MNESPIKVFLIQKPTVDWTALRDYLVETGLTDAEATEYIRARSSGGTDTVAEVAGRLCYASFKPGLNTNVTKIREDPADYLRNVIVNQGHGSILEHSSFTFIFTGISRVLTHELVRHRVGTGISQQSMRYVRVTDRLHIRETPYLSDPMRRALDGAVNNLLETLRDIEAAAGIDEKNFADKKLLTSDIRSFVPQGILTEIMWTANVRTLRHVIEQRTAIGAEWEIRAAFDQVASICKAEAPLCFADFNREPDGVWTPERSKV